MILPPYKPSVMMVRDRRGGYESSDCTGLTAVMTAISAVHRKGGARALFRFRKLIAAGWHDLSPHRQDAGHVWPNKATEPCNDSWSAYSYICWHGIASVAAALKTNWCHGLSAENDTSRPVGQHHCAAENGRSVSFFPLWPPFYDPDGPGEAWNGSGRPRWASLRPDGVRTVPTARGRNPRRGKGVNHYFVGTCTESRASKFVVCGWL